MRGGLRAAEPGVYPSQWIRKAIEEGYVHSKLRLPDPDERQLQPASLDLRLGERAHRLRCSFLPGQQTVAEKLDRFAMGPPIDLRDGAILERNRPYLIPLMEGLKLPSDVKAKANPKSSIGRLDVFTRVISDRGARFDEIDRGYEGALYLEVFSRTFTIKVQTGQSMNQLRLLEGNPKLSDEQIMEYQDTQRWLVAPDQEIGTQDVYLNDGLFLSLDLDGGDRGFIGYRAKKNSSLLDLTSKELQDADQFWERIQPESGRSLVLEPEDFYLLMSREAVSIPPNLAAEMNAYDPTSGELRTHYAGFFDPGFGYRRDDDTFGSRAVLEVRAHDVPFVVEHGQLICKLGFETMREEPEVLYGEVLGSNYQAQEEFLSKYFIRR